MENESLENTMHITGVLVDQALRIPKERDMLQEMSTKTSGVGEVVSQWSLRVLVVAIFDRE